MTANNLEATEDKEMGNMGDTKVNPRHFRMGMQRKSWKEMPPKVKVGKIVLMLVELILTAWALLDIKRRPAEQINGKKRSWVMASFIQPLGPVLYFIFGRKRQTTALVA